MIITSSSNLVQNELERKHDELQQLITQQQEELRKVSEQLLAARYGIFTSEVNVRTLLRLIHMVHKNKIE